MAKNNDNKDVTTLELKLPCPIRDENYPSTKMIWHPAKLVVRDSITGGSTRMARVLFAQEQPQTSSQNSSRRVFIQTWEKCAKREFESLFAFAHGDFEAGKCISVDDIFIVFH